MTEPQLTQIVAGCVLRKDDTFLLVQEQKQSAYGLWCLPAGRVNIGETIELAAVREVLEETGYNVELVRKLRVEHADPAMPVLHSYYAEIIGGELAFPDDELLDCRWLGMDEIRELSDKGALRSQWVMNSILDVLEQK